MPRRWISNNAADPFGTQPWWWCRSTFKHDYSNNGPFANNTTTKALDNKKQSPATPQIMLKIGSSILSVRLGTTANQHTWRLASNTACILPRTVKLSTCISVVVIWRTICPIRRRLVDFSLSPPREKSFCVFLIELWLFQQEIMPIQKSAAALLESRRNIGSSSDETVDLESAFHLVKLTKLYQPPLTTVHK